MRADTSKAIAAGVTAAMLHFGAMFGGGYAGQQAGKYANEHRASHEQRYALKEKSKASSAYGEKLCKWLKSDIGYSSSVLENAFRSNMSDNDKYKLAMEFYNGMKNKPVSQNNPDEVMHLVPYQEADGSFGYKDLRAGRIVAMANRTSNGLFTYYGPDSMISKLFGRGELSTLVDRTADGNYWNKG